MAGFGVPLDCKARFEKERGYPLTFIEKIGKRSNITNNRIIMLINDEEYVEGEDYEFIPYRILLVCPFDNERGLVYERVVASFPHEISKMRYNDPVRIWRGYAHGDIIKITRPDASFYFRKVE